MIAILVGVVIGSCGVLTGFYFRNEAQRSFQRMDFLLDQALNGEKIRREFSEDYTSKLEEKLSNFLQAKNLQQQSLEVEQDSVKELISNIAHQTKTPLTNISLYSQLLTELQPQPPADKYAAEIDKQTGKLTFFIDNLVKTSYLENELIQVKAQENSVNELAEETVASVQPSAMQKNISLKLVQPEQNFTSYFDKRWTKEALLNVIDNAIKYSPAGSAISVEIRSLESFNQIIVTDQGIGIPETQQGAIFERFYRGENSRNTEGLGIGLFLTRKILQLQGGYIRVNSRLEVGASFFLYLKKS